MSTLRALIVGIDDYTSQRRADGQRFAALRGSVNDALAVDRYVRDVLSVPPSRIERLLAPKAEARDVEDRAILSRSQPPTYRNLVAGFERLIDSAKPGDSCIIYYSGHGARAVTLVPEVKGAEGIDECLVPIDAAEPGGGYLRDVELAVLLERLVGRGCQVTLMLDCCFAAGATRGPVTVRGIPGIDRRPAGGASRVAAPRVLASHWRRLRGRHARPDRCWTFDPEGYVCLAACRATESAYEYPFEGGAFRGAFTHALLSGLVGSNRPRTFRALLDRVTAWVRQRFEHQTPIIEGDRDRRVWGASRQQQDHGQNPSQALSGVLVLAVDAPARRLRLGAGSAHGLGVGDKLLPTSWLAPDTSVRTTAGASPSSGPSPSGASSSGLTSSGPSSSGPSWAETPAAERGTTLEVVTVDSVESVAVSDAATVAAIAPGDRVTVVEPGPVEQGRAPALRVAMRVDAPQSLVDAIAHGCGETPSMLVLAPTPVADGVDLQLVEDGRGTLQVLDPSGAPIVNLGSPLAVTETGSAPELLRRLRRIYRFRAVADLRNPNPPPYLAGGLEVTLGPAWNGAAWGQAGDGPPARVDNGPNAVQVGDGLLLRIRNRTTMTLEVAVLDLQPDWGIAQIAPTARAGPSHPLHAGQELCIRLRAALPAGMPRGRDVLKVFATLDPTRFRWLELSALGSAASRNPSVAAEWLLEAEPVSALEHFLASRMSPDTRPRDDGALFAARDWLVETVSTDIRADFATPLDALPSSVSNVSRPTTKGAAGWP